MDLKLRTLQKDLINDSSLIPEFLHRACVAGFLSQSEIKDLACLNYTPAQVFLFDSGAPPGNTDYYRYTGPIGNYEYRNRVALERLGFEPTWLTYPIYDRSNPYMLWWDTPKVYRTWVCIALSLCQLTAKALEGSGLEIPPLNNEPLGSLEKHRREILWAAIREAGYRTLRGEDSMVFSAEVAHLAANGYDFPQKEPTRCSIHMAMYYIARALERRADTILYLGAESSPINHRRPVLALIGLYQHASRLFESGGSLFNLYGRWVWENTLHLLQFAMPDVSEDAIQKMVYDHLKESVVNFYVYGKISSPPELSYKRNPDDKIRDLQRRYQQTKSDEDLFNYQMARYRSGLPIYAHDCSVCVYLGSTIEEPVSPRLYGSSLPDRPPSFVDYWACPRVRSEYEPSLIIRLGDARDNYSSFLPSTLQSILDPAYPSATIPDAIRRTRQRHLMELYQQALQKGLL